MKTKYSILDLILGQEKIISEIIREVRRLLVVLQQYSC